MKGSAVVVTDATLSALSVSGTTLSPAFDAATTTYRATVANSVSQVTITETTSESTATIEYLDDSDATRTDADTMTAGLQVNLSVGSNTVKVKVTAPDTTTTETYTVNVFRVAVPATCSVASMQNRIWTAQMTVGLSVLNGFSEGNHGYLDTKTISYKGTSYTVKGVARGGLLGVSTLFFTLTSNNLGADAADLVLHVDSRQYPFNDATLNTNGITYEWTNNVPSSEFSVDTGVCLALTVDGPDVSSVEITSVSIDATNGIGDAVEATVTFSAAVDITGSPQLELGLCRHRESGGLHHRHEHDHDGVQLHGGGGRRRLPNGVAIAANKLTLNGGTIYGHRQHDRQRRPRPRRGLDRRQPQGRRHPPDARHHRQRCADDVDRRHAGDPDVQREPRLC